MIKKYLGPTLILLGIFILVALVMTLAQVGLPWSNNPISSRVVGLGGGVAPEGLAPNAKMMATDQTMIAPMSASTPAPIKPSITRKITKTGNLSILVETAETAAQNIQAIAESVAGYVSDSNLYEVTPGVKAGSITIRVPADKFDQTIGRIKELALKVENESVNANDVTDQFIDLEARLKNLKAEELQYLDILKKAQKIEDIVNVTNHLNEIRSQIESWQGQLKYLNSQVDLSSITVNLTAEKEVQIFGINWRPLTIINQAIHSLLTGLVNYANIIIAIVIFLPVIILWLATILLITWLIWRVVRFSKKHCCSTKKVKKPAIKS